MKIIVFPFKSKSIALSDDDARRLTRSFLDGDTTADQERRLYAYYRGNNIASDLACYQEMFCWYADLDRNSDDAEAKHRNRSRNLAVAASISALLLIGAGLFAGLPSLSGSDLSVERLYAGSYIIRDGKKITDIKQILPELRQADRYVDSTLSAFSQPMMSDPELILISDALNNIEDPEMKAMLLADIN